MSDASHDPPSSKPHGIAAWPSGRTGSWPQRPALLPDGRPWPRLRILTPASGDEAGLADGIASVARQGFAECRHEVVPSGGPFEAAIAAVLSDASVDFVLMLGAGDLLAPGALTALCLEAVLTGAGAVAGLRVIYDDAVRVLDVPAAGGAPAAEGLAPEGHAPFTGGEILWSRSALADAGIDLAHPRGAALAWSAMAASPSGIARIGRPVLLQPARDARPARDSRPRPPAAGLAVASLTGTGHAGGAGIAHRRLGDALVLCGHRVTDFRLTDESPPAAAEWTDAFPKTEAAIHAGAYDLVLTGNLHGATRSLDVIGRLAAERPAMLVLHDLFPLTGRCAHPRGCPRIADPGCDAACPTPDEYPQRDPRRIAAAFADKRAVLAAPEGPVLLANSAWTAEQAKAFAPPGTPIAPIALAFPTGVFRPRDRRTLRRDLGLPEDHLLILVSAVVLDGPDKSLGDLAGALRRVAGPGVGFVAIGRLDHPDRMALPNLFAPGLVADEDRLAAWYGACDLHVTASRLETLGQTPIEAGLCGTPTLAYRVAGLTTSVLDGVSGRLVPAEPDALAEALEGLVADRAALARLGAFARIAFENRFSPAAAAMSLDAVFRTRGILPDDGERLRFAPATLGHFPFAKIRHPGASGTVAAPSGAVVERLRRIKHRVLGRKLPLWMRRGLYLAAQVRSVRRSAR